MSRDQTKNELAVAIGNKVRALRQGRGWTQEATAARVGCGVELYGRIERGRAVPDMRLLYNLMVVFEVSVDTLLDYRPRFRPRWIVDKLPSPATIRWIAESGHMRLVVLMILLAMQTARKDDDSDGDGDGDGDGEE